MIVFDLPSSCSLSLTRPFSVGSSRSDQSPSPRLQPRPLLFSLLNALFSTTLPTVTTTPTISTLSATFTSTSTSITIIIVARCSQFYHRLILILLLVVYSGTEPPFDAPTQITALMLFRCQRRCPILSAAVLLLPSDSSSHYFSPPFSYVLLIQFPKMYIFRASEPLRFCCVAVVIVFAPYISPPPPTLSSPRLPNPYSHPLAK